MQSPSVNFLSKSDVCARLQVAKRTLESMVVAKRFPPGVQLGRGVYWSEAVVQSWLKRTFSAQEAWQPKR